MTSYGAARAWGLGQRGALAACLYGCSPFFHGYAVEGIAEGSDGWTLALWVWAIGLGRFRLAAIPFALTVLSSWYLGMVALLLMCLAAIRERRALWSLLGLVFAAPALAQFVSAFPGTLLWRPPCARRWAPTRILLPAGDRASSLRHQHLRGGRRTGDGPRESDALGHTALIPAFLSLGVAPSMNCPSPSWFVFLTAGTPPRWSCSLQRSPSPPTVGVGAHWSRR